MTNLIKPFELNLMTSQTVTDFSSLSNIFKFCISGALSLTFASTKNVYTSGNWYQHNCFRHTRAAFFSWWLNNRVFLVR